MFPGGGRKETLFGDSQECNSILWKAKVNAFSSPNTVYVSEIITAYLLRMCSLICTLCIIAGMYYYPMIRLQLNSFL